MRKKEGDMKIVDALEALVKNPFIDTSTLTPFLNKQQSEYYKNSDSHMLRKAMCSSGNFSDMSHVLPLKK